MFSITYKVLLKLHEVLSKSHKSRTKIFHATLFRYLCNAIKNKKLWQRLTM